MHYVDIVAMLAILQYLIFGSLVGNARGKYGIKAPAISGSEPFERIYRVQMNTLELLVALLPAMYVSARYWPAQYVAMLGVIYLIGRGVYWHAYVKAPQSRSLGFTLSMLPVFTLVLAGLVPAVLGKSAA
jgi:glutathione S-transferase